MSLKLASGFGKTTLSSRKSVRNDRFLVAPGLLRENCPERTM